MIKSTRTALAGLLFGALVIAPQTWDSASASASATTFNTATFSVSTVSYPVAAVATASSTNPLGPYVKTGSATFFFYVTNFGNINIKGFTLRITDSNSSAATLKRCATAGATFTRSNVCSDGLSVLTLTPGYLALPLTPGASINLQIAPGKSSTITVDISINSSSIRNPTVTNS